MEMIDLEDLAKRKKVEIIASYHIHWFTDSKFSPPVFYLEKGVVKFISGRHRTLVRPIQKQSGIDLNTTRSRGSDGSRTTHHVYPNGLSENIRIRIRSVFQQASSRH
jgi:hypothetical protein